MTIRRAEAEDRPALLAVWLASVRATHRFLTERDIEELLPLVRAGLAAAAELWVLTDKAGTPIGFMELAGGKVEALFLGPGHLRRGGGTKLIEHARRLKGELTVDVNEQNPDAVRFYEARGFVREGRSALDSSGRPFPLIHMRRPGSAPAVSSD